MKISFDFDNTLHDDFSGAINPIKDKVQSILLKLHNSGHDVYIITRRYGPNYIDKYGLKNEHDKVFDTIFGLIPDFQKEKMIFTNREYKAQTIKELNIDLHIDDDTQEAFLLNIYKKEFVIVHTENWEQLLESKINEYEQKSQNNQSESPN